MKDTALSLTFVYRSTEFHRPYQQRATWELFPWTYKDEDGSRRPSTSMESARFDG
jgi:hypothetical protein